MSDPTPRTQKSDFWLLSFWAAGLLVILTLGLFMPVQTDEITWDISNHRAIADHLNVIALLPQCQDEKDFAKPLPLSWYPYAIVNHVLFMQVDGLLWIRIVGMLCFLLFLAAAWYIAKALSPLLSMSAGYVFVLFSCALCLDALPLLMQVDRPEQTLLLGAAMFMALGLNASSMVRPPARYAGAGLFILTALLVFPSHPRAIALLPVALVCGYELFNRVIRSRVATMLFLLLLTAFAARCAIFWLERYTCPLPIAEPMRSIIPGHSLPLQALQDPGLLLRLFGGAFLQALMKDFYLYKTLAIPFWIPQSVTALPAAVSFAASVFYFLGCLFRLAVFLYCLRSILRTGAKWISERYLSSVSEQASPFLLLLGIAIMISLVGFMCISGSDRMFYHSGFEVPLTFLCAIVCLSMPHPARTFSGPWHRRAMLIFLTALCNLLLLACSYYPFITQPDRQERSWVIRPGVQKISLLSPWGYEMQKKAVTDAYHACGLPPLTEARHLVLDDYSYPVLRQSYEPFEFHYVSNLTSFTPEGIDVKDFFHQLQRYRSDGILFNCMHESKSLDPFVQRYGNYCCIPPSTIRGYPPVNDDSRNTPQ